LLAYEREEQNFNMKKLSLKNSIAVEGKKILSGLWVQKSCMMIWASVGLAKLYLNISAEGNLRHYDMKQCKPRLDGSTIGLSQCSNALVYRSGGC
jgi:hypothetical protein